jgi:hypothetical protein
LLNPNSSFGDATLLDRCGSKTYPTNSASSACDRAGPTAISTDENLQSNDMNILAEGRYFMYPPGGNMSGSQDTADRIVSSSGSPTQAASLPADAAHGFSTAAGGSLDPLAASSQPQPDPDAGGSTDMVTVEIVSPGSDVAAQSAPTIVTQQPVGRVTRSQHGIHKPKSYTDGTVRWGMSMTYGTEEPTSVTEALRDKKWVDAMNSEHQALLKNKTWHLVSPPKGKNIVSGSIR